MYKNHWPEDESRPEDDPHEPTNVPDDLEDRCYRVFEHTESWSVHGGHVTYVYPKTEAGHDDYELMLDIMGFEPGAIFDGAGSYGDEYRLVVQSRNRVRVKWGDESHVLERGGVTTIVFSDEHDGDVRTFGPGDGWNPKNLWKAYIYDDLKRVGHVTDC